MASRSLWLKSGINEYTFYNDLLGPIATDLKTPVAVTLSNPKVVLYGTADTPVPAGIPSRTISIPPPLVSRFSLAENNGDPHLRYGVAHVTSEEFTGMGEAISAFDLTRVMTALDRPVYVTQARFLNWSSVRKEHFIILGAPHLSDWTRRNIAKEDFFFVRGGIGNNNPHAGELPKYSTQFDPVSGSPTVDYGLIWMAGLPSGSRILILAGRTSAGTGGVGDFFSDPKKMRAAYERLRI